MVRGKLGLMVGAALLGSSACLRNSKKASCGKKGLVSNKIVNGNDASPCEWSWQVGLRYVRGEQINVRGEQFWCGGMLVDAEWVATAAHCVDEGNFEVVAGAFNMYNFNGNEQVRGVSQVIKHPNYNSQTYNYDYAMVRLKSPLVLNDCVGTVCLPDADIESGSMCWTTGWGRLYENGYQPNVLQEGMVRIISNTDCYTNYGYSQSDITDKMLCAQGVNKNGDTVDACQGDSGGPLVCESDGQWTLHGATSWGYGCAKAEYPGVWARVYAEVEWMQDIINNPPVPRQCPSFAQNPFPNFLDECKCRNGFCSLNGKDCPTYGGLALFGKQWFKYTCSDCKCI